MRRLLLIAVPALLAGCATRPAPVPIAAPVPPPPLAAPAPAVFAGYGMLAVPPRLADGGFATPNRDLSAAGALWHLRAGLNVAALACRGRDEATLIAGYNALLRRHHAAFDQAYRALGREYDAAAAFDAAMTALYNYYALPPALPELCAAAGQVLTDAALVQADDLPTFVPRALATLDQPYIRIFTQQEAWLAARAMPAGIAAATLALSGGPSLNIDPAVLRVP